jgi:hypothetical protein
MPINLYGAQCGTEGSDLAEQHADLPIMDLDLPIEAICWGFQQNIPPRHLVMALIEAHHPGTAEAPFPASFAKALRFFVKPILLDGEAE